MFLKGQKLLRIESTADTRTPTKFGEYNTHTLEFLALLGLGLASR